MSRAWRDIIARIQSGYGHEASDQIAPGGLAIFCPACPQPGINLADGWEDDEQRQAISFFDVYMLILLFQLGIH